MEEIRLPKFKTKEELEQFAMGLMTENESLKNVIKRKDATIKELDATADKCTKDKFMAEKVPSVMKGINNTQEAKIKELESEMESLKGKTSEDYYKELYDKEHKRHIEAMCRQADAQIELEKVKKMVYKLTNLATFMYGLLNRFQAKRVLNAYGEFNPVDYRL